MTVAERIKVQFPTYPTLADFEAVVDRAIKPGVYRETFVRLFFDEMMKRRMNCNMDGAIREIAVKAAHALADTYVANVSFEGAPSDIPSPTFWNLAGFVEHALIGETSLADVIDAEAMDRIYWIWSSYNNKREDFDELFEYDKDDEPNDIMNLWLDHVELLKETFEYRSLITLKRDLTILSRSYELLVAHFVNKVSR